MKILQLNHIALHVADVDVSVAFYRDVLQLPVLPRPAFDFPGAWFLLGADQELHLIGGRDAAVHSASRGNHLALKVDDLDAWERHLQQIGAIHNPRKTRPDGGMQVFLPDPDGHWIELLGMPETAK